MSAPEAIEAGPASKEVARLANRLGLPMRSRAWRGSAGGWQGREEGSSIDFHEHRNYTPGDDPRHLDWAVYARTDNYALKLFREEVSPRLDLALDVSGSMMLTAEKETRSLELFALVLGIALRDGINVRIYALHSAGQWRRIEPRVATDLRTMQGLGLHGEKGDELPLAEIPWRAGSLRVLISDLLISQPPERELAHLSSKNGAAVVFAPYLQGEAEPEWHGNLELIDCETRQKRNQRVEPYLLTRYRENYRRHFELWQQEARRRHVPFARISCESSLSSAVRDQALPAGAFEVRR